MVDSAFALRKSVFFLDGKNLRFSDFFSDFEFKIFQREIQIQNCFLSYLTPLESLILLKKEAGLESASSQRQPVFFAFLHARHRFTMGLGFLVSDLSIDGSRFQGPLPGHPECFEILYPMRELPCVFTTSVLQESRFSDDFP